MEYLRSIAEKSRAAAAPSAFPTAESHATALSAFNVRNATAQETALLRRSRARCAGGSAAPARGCKRKAISMLSEAQRLVEQCGLEGVAGARLSELRKSAAAHRAEQAQAEKAAVEAARCRVAALEAQLRVELEATSASVPAPVEAEDARATPIVLSGVKEELVALQRERADVAAAQRAVDVEVEQLAAAAAAAAAAALATALPVETTATATTPPPSTLPPTPAASGAVEIDAVCEDGATALVAAEADAEGAEAAEEAEPFAALTQSDAELAAARSALETARAAADDAEAAVAAQRARVDALKAAALRAISASAADGDATAAALEVIAVERGGAAPLEELKQRVGLTTIFKLVGASLLRIDRAASPSSVHATFM